MTSRERFVPDAETIDQQLRLIRRAIRSAYETDERRAGLTGAQTHARVSLTGPQMHAMAVLAQALREGVDGMSIRALSERMGLAQSTVSGLVERLEQKQVVRREVDANDRRCTRVLLVDAVKSYLGQDQRLGPLVDVMEQASDAERQAVLDGLSTLLRLLTGSFVEPSR
jgi:MarR family transcriptional regulator, organic hydroperoxide resistance regulator